jgi:hypothetical protein
LLECGILAHGFLRLRCGECGHDKLLAFSCKRRGFCPSCGARRMSQTAAHLVDHVVPHVPVRQWVLSLPIPLRLLLAAQPELVTPVLQVVQRVVTRHLLDCAGLKAEGHGGAVTLIRYRHAALPELWRRRAQDHRGHPGAAGDPQDPGPPGLDPQAPPKGRAREPSEPGPHFAARAASAVKGTSP